MELMELIEWLLDKIDDELHDSKEYAKVALLIRDDRSKISRVLYENSLEEMEHMNRLHGIIVEIIEEYRKTEGEPSAEMLASYNRIHEKHIKKAAKVKSMQDMYKAG